MKNIFTLIFVLLLCNACTKDTSAPSIEILDFQSGSTFHPSDTILFRIHFSDDLSLHSYGFAIVYDDNDSCEASPLTLHNSDIPFLEETNDIVIQSGIIIPDLDICAGKYNLSITCKDKKRNINSVNDYFYVAM